MPVIESSRREQQPAPGRLRSALTPLGEWPHGVARLGVLVCVALALVTVARMYFADALSGSNHWATRNGSLDYMARSVPFAEVVSSPQVLEDARLWMPEDATYRIVTGESLEGPLGWAAPGFVQAFLLPRREVERDASWVFCFRCDVALLEGFEVLSEGGGIVFGRVGR